jgi:AbrB family looped-hinge helix DNA binding protein
MKSVTRDACLERGTLTCMARILTEETTYGDRGRVVLPSAVRSELGWTPGTRLLVTTDDDGSVHLRPYQAAADALQGMFADLPGNSLVDELRADRRAEVADES